MRTLLIIALILGNLGFSQENLNSELNILDSLISGKLVNLTYSLDTLTTTELPRDRFNLDQQSKSAIQFCQIREIYKAKKQSELNGFILKVKTSTPHNYHNYYNLDKELIASLIFNESRLETIKLFNNNQQLNHILFINEQEIWYHKSRLNNWRKISAINCGTHSFSIFDL